MTLLLAVLALLTLCVPALAADTEISTVVPASHRVTVICGSGGGVVTDGMDPDGPRYIGTNTFTVGRLSDFRITAVPDAGYALDAITSDSAAGLTLQNASATLRRVNASVTVYITFKAAPAAQTPAPTPPAVEIHADETDADSLTPDQREALSGLPGEAELVELTVWSGGEQLTELPEGGAEVRLRYGGAGDDFDDEDVTLWYLNDDGTMEQIPYRYEDGFLVFTATRLQTCVILRSATAAPEPAQTPEPTPEPEPGATPEPKPDTAPAQGLADGEPPHCFICRWVGRDIDPWCWIIPLLILLALCLITWRLTRKRRDGKKKK